MSVIEELLKFQNYNNNLKDIQKNLKTLKTKNKIKELEMKLIETENRLEDLKIRIEKSKNKLNKNNHILKNYDYELEKIEKSLYEEGITDLKQLGFLDNEREIAKKDIDEKEEEILLQMDNIEGMTEEFLKRKKGFKELKKEYTKLVKEHKSMIEELNSKIIDEQEKIDELSSKIDKNIIKKYNELIKNRGVAVVEAIDNRCSGCNMLLPSIILDKLRINDKIIHCENCDRILYTKIKKMNNGN